MYSGSDKAFEGKISIIPLVANNSAPISLQPEENMGLWRKLYFFLSEKAVLRKYYNNEKNRYSKLNMYINLFTSSIQNRFTLVFYLVNSCIY